MGNSPASHARSSSRRTDAENPVRRKVVLVLPEAARMTNSDAWRHPIALSWNREDCEDCDHGDRERTERLGHSGAHGGAPTTTNPIASCCGAEYHLSAQSGAVAMSRAALQTRIAGIVLQDPSTITLNGDEPSSERHSTRRRRPAAIRPATSEEPEQAETQRRPRSRRERRAGRSHGPIAQRRPHRLSPR